MTVGLPERRACKRFRSELEGWIEGNDSAAELIPCKLWDISEKGVRLIFPEPCEVPLEFKLHIPGQNAVAKARLIWSDGYFFGAQFSD